MASLHTASLPRLESRAFREPRRHESDDTEASEAPTSATHLGGEMWGCLVPELCNCAIANPPALTCLSRWLGSEPELTARSRRLR